MKPIILLFYLSFCLSLQNDTLIEINRTLLDYSNSNCKDNPFLFILPNKMRHSIEFTLSSKPKKNINDFCKNDNIVESCCTHLTFTNIKDYLNDNIYTSKKNIFETNLYYFKNIIDEHKRNLVKGFKLKESTYNDLFEEYHQKVREIIKLAEEIVNESAEYNWNAFCNYICNFPQSLNNCKIYAISYRKNNEFLFDFEYHCKVEEAFIDNIVKNIKKFEKMKDSLNATLDNYYKIIKEKSINFVQHLLDSSTFEFYSNSINDGHYVSLAINQNSYCRKEKNTQIYNNRLKDSIIFVDTSCENLYAKPCGLFSCLDDFFMEFYDIHENNSSYIVGQFNYSKVNIEKIDNNTDRDFVFYHFENEMSKLTGNKLKFAKEYFVIYHFYLIFIILIAIL